MDVDTYIREIDNDRRRQDSETMLAMIRGITDYPEKIWYKTIVGFGTYHYRYESGREGDHMITGFAPRKQNLVVYIMPGFQAYPELMGRLGKYKTGKSCLYINTLDDVDLEVLEELIRASIADMEKKYECR